MRYCLLDYQNYIYIKFLKIIDHLYFQNMAKKIESFIYINEKNLVIPDVSFEEDFSIIYKGEGEKRIYEIRTSKNELLKKLRYFQNKSHELEHMEDIYIRDKFKYEHFNQFISSIRTQRLTLDDSNYLIYHELSSKYQYYELQDEVKKFIQERPDLRDAIFQLTKPKSDNDDANDTLKEEIIAINLDFCLQHGILDQIPVPMLIRILNSPSKILKDHHQLFEFILKKLGNEQNDQKSIEILISCLDYKKMSGSEIQRLFSEEVLKKSVFKPKNSNEIIISLFEELKIKDEQNSRLERKIESLNAQINEQNNTINLNKQLFEEQLQKIQEILNEQSKIISDQKVVFEDSIKKMKEENEKKLSEMQSNQTKTDSLIQKVQRQQENQQTKIGEIENRISKNEQDYKDIKNKKDEIKQNINIIKQFKENEEFNGIINYIRTLHKNDIYNEINMTSSSIYNGREPNNVLNLDEDEDFASDDKPNQWLCFDFKNHFIIPNYYTIKCRCGHYYSRGWILEGSNDNSNWTKIDERSNISFPEDEKSFLSFKIENPTNQKFRFFRITATQPYNSNSDYFLIIESFEFFGIYTC